MECLDSITMVAIDSALRQAEKDAEAARTKPTTDPSPSPAAPPTGLARMHELLEKLAASHADELIKQQRRS